VLAPNNRIDAVFAQSPPGLWPFLAAGDPDLQTTEELLMRLADAPIRGVELGFPFSDPVADGPVIQAAFNRALEAGIRVAQIFEMVARIRKRFPHPLLAMVSASIVYRVDEFVSRAAKAGFDGLIVPDLSLEEAPSLAESVRACGMHLSMLIAPTTPADRRQKIAEVASGFLYYVSVQGITGQRNRLSESLGSQVRQTKTETSLPVLVGFGISRPEHVREVCSIADGAIVGSAIVQQISQLASQKVSRSAIVDSATKFIESLVAQPSSP
jgi:tryptophan synthase alpha chain